MGGGAKAPASSSSHAASMLGDVGRTTASGTDSRSSKSFVPGENIYGPFEAGFGSQQDNILGTLGCSPGSLGHIAGGIDTETAEQMVAKQCSVTLPRVQDNRYISLLDECGGHTEMYHFHEKMVCLYSATGGHSAKIGDGLDNKPIYGKWEHADNSQLPQLDACGGHYGRTPESPGAEGYHYHVQAKPPFTIGCFGPNDDGSLVSVAQCRGFYTGCDGNLVTVETPTGSKQYDDWCPCFDAAGSNSGVGIQELPSVLAGDPIPSTTPWTNTSGDQTTAAASRCAAGVPVAALLALAAGARP